MIYGPPNGTRTEKKAHRQWCSRNSDQSWEIYQEAKVKAQIEAKERILAVRHLANKARVKQSTKPEWMSMRNWKSYRAYRNDKARQGEAYFSPEAWVDYLKASKVSRYPAGTSKKDMKLYTNACAYCRKTGAPEPTFDKWQRLRDAARERRLTKPKKADRRTLTELAEAIRRKLAA